MSGYALRTAHKICTSMVAPPGRPWICNCTFLANLDRGKYLAGISQSFLCKIPFLLFASLTKRKFEGISLSSFLEGRGWVAGQESHPLLFIPPLWQWHASMLHWKGNAEQKVSKACPFHTCPGRNRMQCNFPENRSFSQVGHISVNVNYTPLMKRSNWQLLASSWIGLWIWGVTPQSLLPIIEFLRYTKTIWG